MANKYIDAEKLIANLRLQKRELKLSIQSQGDYGQSCHIIAYENILSLITSLQQEQPEAQNGKFVFPKYLYARTKDNKTIDMSYVPQDMTAVEYIRNDFVEQKQSEMDLKKEIDITTEIEEHASDMPHCEFSHYTEDEEDEEWAKKEFRYFYERGLNASKEDKK